ncbi:MAG: DUF4173 domain-containing protein [Candidatus Andeanibacterium colombiense]|uniref:DUF4173 domain-containing protein n=1 Tax=Candidatus Andeanibacterium colombiense TaxID=3121345 RepID=A0AAJ6BNM4_9SPHN|nr:MAG: DUF4173 domain-containing protein [Sphingomonadaceae bacterium]
MIVSARRFRSSIVSKLVPAVLLVVLGDWMFYQRSLFGGYIGLYGLALIAGLIAGHAGVRRERRAWLAVAAALIFAGALVYDPSLLGWTLFWTAMSLAALLPRTIGFDDGWRWFQRLGWHALRSPFGPLIDFRHALKVRRRRPRPEVRQPLTPLLALPALGSLAFFALFVAANPLLARMVFSIRLPSLGEFDILRPILWTALLALAWSMLRPRLASRLLPTFDGRGDLPLPGVSVASVTLSLVAFNLVFALQNVMDIVYLWGRARLPGDITMADYAHRGAYPLIATALLAALFVLVTLRPGSATAQTPAIRGLVLLWVAQNIFLVASSIERMMDYVGSYSLTGLRIVVLGWMWLVAFGLAAICWRMLTDKSASWLINVNLGAAGILLTIASFADLTAIAAQWNVRHAREAGGTAVNLDLCYLYYSGSSALLPLLELERRPDLTPRFREKVQGVRSDLYAGLMRELGSGQWSIHRQRMFEQAQRELAEMNPAPLPDGPRDCDGDLIGHREAPPQPIMMTPAPTAPAVPRAASPASTSAPAPALR